MPLVSRDVSRSGTVPEWHWGYPGGYTMLCYTLLYDTILYYAILYYTITPAGGRGHGPGRTSSMLRAATATSSRGTGLAT